MVAPDDGMAGVRVLLVSSRNGKGLVLPKVKLPLDGSQPAVRGCKKPVPASSYK